MHLVVMLIEFQFFTSRQVLYFVIGIRVSLNPGGQSAR